MAYWHMQLHPNDVTMNRERELLKSEAMIGVGDDWNGGELPIEQFKNEMALNDIVVVKHGSNPIAIVRVIGKLEDIGANDNNRLDWFRYRRKIEILEILEENKYDFPQPRMTLQKSITNTSLTYKYIDSWYKRLKPEEAAKVFEGIKLRRVEIEKYKTLKDFTISFEYNGEPLPIIVIGGVNGSGKTSLLEFVKNFVASHLKIGKKNIVKFDFKDREQGKTKIEILDYKNIADSNDYLKNYFDGHIEYLATDTHKNLENISNAIRLHLKQLIWEDKYPVDEAYAEVRLNISKIFEELGFNINFFSLDKDENVYFASEGCGGFECAFKIDEASTGQKTLLTKVLYLYLNDVRNKIVLIDEPELSLHPNWQNKIFQVYEKFAKDNNCQVILATHSPHIIAQTPHKNLRLLVEEDGKIVAKQLTGTPLDRDVNTIIKTVMGADYLPKWLEEKHEAYRKLCEDGKKNTEEAEKLKREILEFESPNSSFFQRLAFDMELMG